MSNLYLRYPEGKRKALTLSYDDGVLEDKKLIELMEQYHICGTFNLFSEGLEKAHAKHNFEKIAEKWTLEEAKELYDRPGIEVAVHGYTHPFLETLSPECCTYEIIKDRENLENLFCRPVRGMAYPYGTYSDGVVETLKRCGIVYSRTVESSEDFKLPTDWLRLKPTCHHSNPKLPELTDRFLAEDGRRATLFYLWGHAFEFHMDNNWEVIENFFSKVADRDDIWYATNIEIYDYVTAFHSLWFSVNREYVHNPSAIPVWFSYASEIGCVKPGETLKLC